ncbi:MAG TPA: hypothetical protein VM348_07205, partial [Brevundimonas sp.]|nr:hypothetical protein [Brevundimonas sp.]
MSVTYPADPLKPYGDRSEVRPLTGERMDLNPHLTGAAEEPFVPVYARRGKAARGNGGKIKTWMILAPVGAIVLGGFAAMMLNGEETTTPLAEPAATAPVVAATPLAAAAPATSASTPAPVQAAPAPAPVLREATPVRRAAPAPARRAVTPTAPRAAATATVSPRTTTPTPTSPSTSTLNT